MNQKNKIAMFLLSLFSLQILSGCTTDDQKQDEIKSEDNTNIQSDSEEKEEEINIDTSIDNAPELAVSSACTGCGRCVRIDSEHFDINNATGKAFATSQENLDTDELKQAINNCPASAISL